MKKGLLFLTLMTTVLSGISAQSKFADQFKFKSSVLSASDFIAREAANVQPANTIQEAIATNPQKITASVTLMAWDFETIEDDNDWAVYDLDSLTTKVWSKPVGWTVYSETTTNKVLASSSWFDPAGTADDWVFSEAVDVPNEDGAYEVAWDARASNASYQDGYQFRIMEDATFESLDEGFTETTFKKAVLTAFQGGSTLALTVAKENATWTTRRYSLDAYKGKKIRLIWRNNSDDMDRLYLDNVIAFKKDDYATATKITTTPVVPYAQVPQFLAKDYSGVITAKIDNNGSKALSGVTASFSAYKNNILDLTDVISVGDLAVAGTNSPVSKAYNITAANPANSYYFTAEVDATEYAMSYSESVTVTGPVVSDSIYARDNGVFKGYTSVSSTSTSANKKIGNSFEFISSAKLHAVNFNIYNCTALTTIVRVYSTTNYITFTQVAESSPIALTTGVSSETLYTAKFDNLTLPAGKYLVTLDEPASLSIGLVTTSNSAGVGAYYTTTGTTWYSASSCLYIRLKVSQVTTGVNDILTKNLNVYYANNSIVVKGLEADVNASIFSLAGQELISTKLSSSNNIIPTNLSNGVYLLKIGGSAYKIMVK